MLAPRLFVHFMKERNSLKYLVAFSFQMCFGLVRSMCCIVSSRKPLCLCARVTRTHACLWSRLPAQGPGWMLFPLRTWERTLAAALPSRPVSAEAGTPWPNLALCSVLLVMSIRPAVSDLSVFKLNLAESHLMAILCS